MSSHALFTRLRLHARPDASGPEAPQQIQHMRFLHRFSDGLLHTLLLAALLLLSAVALYKAATLSYDVWRLERVVITGHATHPGHAQAPARAAPSRT